MTTGLREASGWRTGGVREQTEERQTEGPAIGGNGHVFGEYFSMGRGKLTVDMVPHQLILCHEYISETYPRLTDFLLFPCLTLFIHSFSPRYKPTHPFPA